MQTPKRSMPAYLHYHHTCPHGQSQVMRYVRTSRRSMPSHISSSCLTTILRPRLLKWKSSNQTLLKCRSRLDLCQQVHEEPSYRRLHCDQTKKGDNCVDMDFKDLPLNSRPKPMCDTCEARRVFNPAIMPAALYFCKDVTTDRSAHVA